MIFEESEIVQMLLSCESNLKKKNITVFFGISCPSSNVVLDILCS